MSARVDADIVQYVCTAQSRVTRAACVLVAAARRRARRPETPETPEQGPEGFHGTIDVKDVQQRTCTERLEEKGGLLGGMVKYVVTDYLVW